MSKKVDGPCLVLLQNYHSLSRLLVTQLVDATKACDWAAAATALRRLDHCRPKTLACHLGHFCCYALPRATAQDMKALLQLVQQLVSYSSLAGYLTRREGVQLDRLDWFIASYGAVRVCGRCWDAATCQFHVNVPAKGGGLLAHA